jgi:uncharacterized protein (TIGR02266 family)
VFWTEKRGRARVPARIKVDYGCEDNFLISYSKDISADGMFICAEGPPPPGTLLKLVFSVEDLHEVTLTARVVWTNSSEGPDKGMGLQFVNPPAYLREAILTLVRKVAVLEPKSPEQ